MATNQQLQNALDALNANPMFRLSMSSLEFNNSTLVMSLCGYSTSKQS